MIFTDVSGVSMRKMPNFLKYRLTVSTPYRTNTLAVGIAVQGIPVPGGNIGEGVPNFIEVSGNAVKFVCRTSPNG